MEHTLEHRIRQRAYEIWDAHGQADGKADEYWLAAEREIIASLNGAAEASAASKAKRARAGSRTGARATKSNKTSATALSKS